MATYPITLPSHPQQSGVVHQLNLNEGSVEGNGFELISTWLKLPWMTSATDTCVTCGATLELPDGSMAEHLKNYQAANSGKDRIVRIEHFHVGNIPFTLPPGTTVVTDPSQVMSIQDAIKKWESS
jgi:hypothetical protein